MTAKAKADLTITKCKGCGKLAVYLNDYRLTEHKACVGTWEIVQQEKIETADVRKAMRREPRKPIDEAKT